MTRIYFFKSNGLTKKDQVKMTKEVTNLLSDTAKRRQKDGNETATSDKVIIRTSLGHFLRYVAMIFAVLTLSMANIGVAWAQTSWVRLDSIDFTNTTNFPAVTYVNASADVKTTVNGVFFWAKKGSKAIKVNDGVVGVDFQSQNISSSGQHGIAIPVTGVNGSLKVIVYHNYNTTSAKFKVGISHADGNDPSKSQTWDQSPSDGGTKNKNDYVLTKSSLGGTDYIVWVGEASSSYTLVKRVAIYTEAPSCAAADLTASNITSNGDQEAGTGITFSKVGTPASGDAWYWQTSATGTDKAYNATSPYTTATTAGSYTVYLRAYNTSGDCWGTAASMTNTIYPAPSAMIHNTFAVNAAWSSTIATQDKTNITSLNAMAAVGESVGSGSNKDGLTQKIPSQSSEDASKYMSLSFNVASGKQLNVTSVVFDEQPVTGTGTFKVSISDNQGSATKTQTIASGAAGSKHTLTLNGDIVGSFKGTVTVKVWAYGWDAGYRFGDYFYIHGTVTDAAACSAPSSVGITGTNKYLGGQTISLTATPVGGSGTATYQWQKEISSVWTNVANGDNISGATSANLQITSCGHGNSGQYRCVVSTGTNCSTESSAYGVHVFSIYGKYYSGEYSHNEITWTSGTTGTATIHLNASSTYLFKVWSNDGYYYGNGENNYIIQPVNWNCGTGNHEMRLLTGPEGDYTFTVNIEHGLDGSPYVNVQVGYPSVSHPSTGYMYITKWWDHCYVHYWEGTNNDLSPWGYDPEINSDRYVEICGTNYWYFPVIDTYNKLIAKDAAGDPSNTTGDQVSTSNGGRYITHDGSWGWHDFSTYTITYAANGGGGSMTATSGICPDADQAITSNAFTAPTGCASFAHWTANVAVKVGGATVAAGNPIASGATIEDINSDITLTAVWKLATPTITDNGDNTFSISGSMAGSSYYYTTNNSTPTTSSSLYSSAVDFSAGEANITAKAIAHKDGYVDSDVASQACTYHAAVTCTGDPTALVSGTLYQVSDMASACLGEITGTGQYFYGLSSNGKFYINGTTNSNNASTGTVEIKTASNTIDKINFTGIAWFKGAGTTTCRSIKFVVPSAGTLTIYGKTSSSGGNVVIKTESSGNTTVIANSVNAYASGSTTVSAGTYYVLSDGGSAAIVGLKFVESACSTPAVPTAFSAGSITSTGATFSITDAADAASYDIYYSTSSDAPTAVTAATTTSDSKTKAVTGLTASTTYYAWVRSVCDASHKSDWVALSGSSFTTSAGGGCTPQSVVKTVLSSTTAGTTTGYNNNEYAGSATIVTFQGTPIDGGYKMQSGSKLFVTLKKGNFVEGDKINIVITKASDLTNTTGKLPIFYNASSPALLTTIDAASAGTYTYTLTASDITTLGSNKTIGVFRSSSTTENNPYVKSVEVEGCRDWTVDETAPTFVSSVPANGATGVATSGTIVLTFSEALGTVDPSKFTLTGATKGAVSIDGSDATKVNIAYSGAANEATVTLATAAAAVSDLAGNALASALSNISFTTAAAAPAGDCITIAYFETTSHSNSSSKPDNAGKYIYGYTNSAKTEAYAYTITSSTGDNKGQGTGESDYLRMNYGTTVTIYADNTTTGGTPASFSNVTSVSVDFKMKNSAYYTSFDIYVGSTKIANNVSLEGAAQSAFTTFTYDNLEQLSGTVRIVNKGSGSSNYHFYVDNIQICTSSLPACTTPILPTLTAKTVCEGGDADAAWDATITNSGSLVSGETVAYSWVKKGGSTPVSSVATYQPTDVTEAMAGTYVVTATVSADGKASKSASQEVDLSVTEGTEVTGITANKATVYPGNSVTLTATANTSATWQWYTCTNTEGDGAVIISGAESASYTIASAGAAGTYYYKAVATGSCGTGSMVYTLTVSAAAGGDCETEFWFAYDSDRPEGAAAATHITTALTAGSTASASITIDGNTYAITKRSSNSTGPVTIVIPEGNTGTVYVLINGSNSRSLTLTKGGVSQWSEVPVGWTSYSITGLDEGTYTLSGSGNLGWGIIALKLCSGATCTDPEVTASVNNSTACVGTSVTFTATGAHASATYQWQKYSGGAWTNIASATASTYNIASVVAGDAGKYRVIASHDCNRTSNEVTLSIPSAPNFGSTVPASVSVMQTIALSINTVEATDATKYRWYKSADATWDAGDVEIGTNKELIKAYDSEAIGSPSYYIFCRAQNACGTTTSTPIAVNVTAYIEEDCATRGNEGAAEFGFQNSGCGQGTYNSASCWTMNSNSKILVYSAPDGKYFKTMKVTIASSSASKASYNWSTDGGSSYTSDGVAITGLTTTLTEKTINLSAHGNVNEVKIGRNFGSGESSGTLYVSKICFEYTDACTATTVTPSATSETYEMDGSSFTEPTFTVKHGGTAFDPQPTLTYSSSNEDIASVDDDGTVTFNGEAGTVTITASYAGGTISATEYCASSGSYTINVSCPGGAPKVVADGSVNMSGCNSSVTLNAKTQADGDFADGTYQWFRNGEEIDGATSSSYTATQAGTYTVARTNTSGCTTPSTNSAVVTSETTEPEVERLVPFQYYHVDKEDYSDQMKMRHLFAVKNSGTLDGKHFKMYVSRNGAAATDVTSSNALVVVPNRDGHVDTVKVDLNKLKGKYSENDELVFTCKAIDCTPAVSDVYKNTITMRVIGATPTLALICSGSNKAGGTRKTSELTVGGDFLTGYNVADLCQQTGNTSFDANTEWGLYTRLKENYIVTPVNGYAVFNKLNYEPFDILLLTDYPKASKSDAAATVLDDMADLCDYRPMLSFKAHMVAKQPSKWAAKGFTTSPVVPKNTRTRLNIVCYAHPMFSTLKSTATHIQKDNDDPSQIVYTMLTGAGYEGSKGLQGFELEAAENFVTIGLVHYNATPTDGSPSAGLVTWAPGSEDRMLVTAVERQENLEARMIMFAVNCGAQSKFTETGRNVVLKCLEYLLDDDPLHVADCSFTFDNGAGNSMTAEEQAEACESCTGTKGDGKWSTAANWGPDYVVRPGKDTEVKIAAPVTVDPAVGAGAATNFTPKVRSVRILEGGKVEIPAGSYLEVVSTIRRQDGNDIYPTEVEDLHIGSSTTGNGTLILNNSTEDTKAQVDMYSKGFIDHSDPANEPKGVKNYQYIGTPFVEVNALYNYYGSWIYYWKADGSGWKAVKNGGPMTAWTGYCITQEAPTYHQMSGTLTATGTVDINVPADANMVVGNSWTAPIDISKFATTDFENLEANVYFFNTGVDKTGTAGAAGSRYAGSTYVTVPINTAPYTEDDHIPSLQGFFVKNTSGSAGTLHLDYDKHVRGSSRAGRLSEEMHAPARRTALSSDEPTVLKIKVSGENYDDKLLLLEREDFTEGFDNGWDGDKWDGNESALYIYTTDSEGTENSVSAVPELEGTVIGFRAGEDDAYTLNFEYLNSDEPLYLYDVENNTYTQIMTSVTYRFFTTDKSKHARFIITRKSPQITTAVGNVSDDGLRSSKVKKLLLDNKLFILRNGMLYDATGKVVK